MRPTDRPLLACSLSSSGNLPSEWPYTPPCCIQRRMAPLFFYSSLPPPAESLGNQVGRLTFIFLSSWGLEAHTTLRNGCRCHRHCEFSVCGLVPWHLRNPDQSTCVSKLYMAGPQAFSCPPSCICVILTVAWFGTLSRVCLHAYLPRLFCFSVPQDMCTCMSAHH